MTPANHPPATPAARRYLPLLAVAVCLAAGCGGDDFEAEVIAYAEAAGAKATANAELAGLIAEVENERGLPTQLAAPTGPDADNAAVALSAAYEDPLPEELTLTIEALLEARDPSAERTQFVVNHAPLIQRTAAAVDLPRCRFRVGHEYGFFGRMDYLDDVTLAVGLLVLRAEEAGRLGEPTRALADLLRSLRVVQSLSEVRRVEARVLAATLRSRVLRSAERLFVDKFLRRTEAERLYVSLRDQLADWPTDRRMLTGDRAMVIHAYEAIRKGKLHRIVTFAEQRRLAVEGVFDAMRHAPPEQIDADQASYLAAMKRLLADADAPHHARLDAIEEAYAVARAGPMLFADPLFLADLTDTLRLVAEDRARTEAWSIALAAAAELRPPPFRTNPVTGAPYISQRDDQYVRLSNGEATPPSIVLPRLTL